MFRKPAEIGPQGTNKPPRIPDIWQGLFNVRLRDLAKVAATGDEKQDGPHDIKTILKGYTVVAVPDGTPGVPRRRGCSPVGFFAREGFWAYGRTDDREVVPETNSGKVGFS